MKRTLLAALFVLPCLALPALAEDAGPATPAKSTHTRVTWQQHFAQANSAHDGHLTLEQAKSGYPSLFRHFAEIDAGGEGVRDRGGRQSLAQAAARDAPASTGEQAAAAAHVPAHDGGASGGEGIIVNDGAGTDRNGRAGCGASGGCAGIGRPGWGRSGTAGRHFSVQLPILA